MSYFGMPRDDVGGVDKIKTDDDRAIRLLEHILIVLQKLELHASVISDEVINQEDIGEENDH